jgi:hypothetical protein
MTTAPRPMRARFRAAWKTTCGSSAQAWTQRSPPDRPGSSSSPGSGGSSASARGLARSESEAVVEEARAEAERDGQLRRRQAEGLAGVHRRRRGNVHLSDELSGGHPPGGPGPLAQQVAQVASPFGRDVKRGEVQPVLGRRRDPGLVDTVEPDASGAARVAEGALELDPAERDARPHGPRARDQPSPREPGRGHP